MENALLRQQLIVLERGSGLANASPKPLTWRDRTLIVFLASTLGRPKAALIIAQPDTVLRWHRDLLRRYWRRRSRSVTSRIAVGLQQTGSAAAKPIAASDRVFGTERQAIMVIEVIEERDTKTKIAVHRWEIDQLFKLPDQQPGLMEVAVRRLMQEDEAIRWSVIVGAYQDEHTNLGKAAELLDLTELELRQRFIELGVPLRIGPSDLAEARAEVEAVRAWFADSEDTASS
jgi:predicted HTH domain antitoxin